MIVWCCTSVKHIKGGYYVFYWRKGRDVTGFDAGTIAKKITQRYVSALKHNCGYHEQCQVKSTESVKTLTKYRCKKHQCKWKGAQLNCTPFRSALNYLIKLMMVINQ